MGGLDAYCYIWANYLYTTGDVNTETLDEDAVLDILSRFFIEDVAFSHDGLTGSAAFAASLADDPYVRSELMPSTMTPICRSGSQLTE